MHPHPRLKFGRRCTLPIRLIRQKPFHLRGYEHVVARHWPAVRFAGKSNLVNADGGYAATNTGTFVSPVSADLVLPPVELWLSALGTYTSADVVVWGVNWAPVIAGLPAPLQVALPLDAGGNPRLSVTPRFDATYFDGVLTITLSVNGTPAGDAKTLVISSLPGYPLLGSFTWV